MKRNVFLTGTLVFVTACTPLSLYYKEGTPVDRLNRDEGNCRVEGLRAVPVDTDTRIIPGTETPKTICDASGACHTVWVQITPDKIETYDANENARREYVNGCMAKKGYERVRLPQCGSEIVQATRTTPTRVLPPLNANSCGIRLQTGQWQIVSPPG